MLAASKKNNHQPSADSEQVIANVQSVLSGYAERGIFQKLSKQEEIGGKKIGNAVTTFEFRWLTDRNLCLKIDSNRNKLELVSVLPAVPARSHMDKQFRIFLKERCDKTLPLHRRLDDERFTFKCTNKKQNISISISYVSGDEVEASKTAVKLYHEIFNHFLMDGPYQNYMIEQFGISEE